MKNTRGRKWLVIANCQADGIANCIEALMPGLEVVRFDIAGFEKQRHDVLGTAHQFGRALVSSRFRTAIGDDVDKLGDVTWSKARDQIVAVSGRTGSTFRAALCVGPDQGPSCTRPITPASRH